MARRHDSTLFRNLMRYPDNMPGLSSLHPPGGNTQPQGILESHFERRKRGELPETY